MGTFFVVKQLLVALVFFAIFNCVVWGYVRKIDGRAKGESRSRLAITAGRLSILSTSNVAALLCLLMGTARWFGTPSLVQWLETGNWVNPKAHVAFVYASLFVLVLMPFVSIVGMLLGATAIIAGTRKADARSARLGMIAMGVNLLLFVTCCVIPIWRSVRKTRREEPTDSRQAPDDLRLDQPMSTE